MGQVLLNLARVDAQRDRVRVDGNPTWLPRLETRVGLTRLEIAKDRTPSEAACKATGLLVRLVDEVGPANVDVRGHVQAIVEELAA